MSCLTRARCLLAIAIVGLLAFGAAPALATSDTQSQNPELTVTVSLPDQVTAGDTFAAAASVTNNTAFRQTVKLAVALTGRTGQTYSVSYPVKLGAGETVSTSVSFRLPRWVPKGTYSVSLSASNQAGTSQATATTQIV
jgi:uncharacterized protein YfaS (alpha-2-macroglobulin family)